MGVDRGSIGTKTLKCVCTGGVRLRDLGFKIQALGFGVYGFGNRSVSTRFGV